MRERQPYLCELYLAKAPPPKFSSDMPLSQRLMKNIDYYRGATVQRFRERFSLLTAAPSRGPPRGAAAGS